MNVRPSAGNRQVVVVGGGNAGFSAALAARETGARVILLEKAPPPEAGGNSFYSAGAFRVVHDGVSTIAGLTRDRTTLERLGATRLEAYTEDQFRADLDRVTEGRTDPQMASMLVAGSKDVVPWLAGHGVEWRLMYERQAYRSGGRWVFSGGLAIGTVGGGRGLIEQHTRAARATGVDLRYGCGATGIGVDSNGDVAGVTVRTHDGTAEQTLEADAVVLTSGGFEASAAMRERHLGEGWGRAIVRGNPLNTGEVLQMALDLGAEPFGDWSSCHSVAWDSGAPPQGGNRTLTNQLTRQSYPLGIVVNCEGRRFVDEGADFRNYTYAKYGREILEQPHGRAWQIFDSATRPLLRKEEYDSAPITMACADTIDDLAAQLGIDAAGLRETVREFNRSIVDVPFDPAIKDGRASKVDPPKSNWALALEKPPFYGYAVSCGITFTFGGLHVDRLARVLARGGRPIPGLYAAGEIVGGLFSGNYPGGSGLTAGTVFGRLAGTAAGGARHDESG